MSSVRKLNGSRLSNGCAGGDAGMERTVEYRTRRSEHARSMIRHAVAAALTLSLMFASKPVVAGGILQAVGGAIVSAVTFVGDVIQTAAVIAFSPIIITAVALGAPAPSSGGEGGGFGQVVVTSSPLTDPLTTLIWFGFPVCKQGGNQPFPSCSQIEPRMDPTPAAVAMPMRTPSANSDSVTSDEATGIKDDPCPDPAKKCALSATGNQAGTRNKVLPFNGQEMFDQTDLFIPGRDDGVNIEIMRRHLSGIAQMDPHFGPAWALNYVHTFVAVNPGAPAQGNGTGELTLQNFGRTDRFAKIAGNMWEGRDGRFDRLVYDGNGHAILAMPGGTMLHFKVVRREMPGQPVLIFGQLSGILSPRGNMIRIRLDWSVPTDGMNFIRPRRILSLTDSFNRSILFNYEDPRDPDLVTRIVDFSGREVRYQYSCKNQLTSSTSPAVRSTAGLNDFPQGKTTKYTYAEAAADEEYQIRVREGLSPQDIQFIEQNGGFAPLPEAARFRFSLASVVSPNQIANGQSRLAWTYWVEPHGGDRHTRVKSHTVGNAGVTPAAGGTYQYDYQLFKPTSFNENTRVSKTTVTDRLGTRTELEYTSRGQLLKETIFTRGLRTAAPPSYTRTYVYNPDGEPISYTDANGIRTTYGVSNGDSMARASQRNETARQIFPAPGKETDQSSIRGERVYEPLFNNLFKEIDPRGYEPGNDVADFTTTYIYAYMENLDATIDMVAPKLGMSVDEVRARFAALGITNMGDVNGDGTVRQFTDNVVQIIHPPVTLPAEAARMSLTTAQNAVELFGYNNFGQKIRHVDAEGNVTTWEYFGVADPDGDGVVDFPGAATDGGGYLRREIRDAESGTARNSGQNPTPVRQTVSYEYRAQGSFPANKRGVPTAIIDARGIRHTFLVNERDQVVKKVSAAQTSGSPEAGLTPFAYEEHTLYDANDNVVELRIQNKDSLNGANDFIRHQFSYDILDQKIAEVWDVGGIAIRNEFGYDKNQNRIAAAMAAGSPEVTIYGWTFDERDKVKEVGRGIFSADGSLRTTEIDRNGNVTAWIDADGDREQIVYDGFDRKRWMVDRVGNRTQLRYDSASNLTIENHFGPVAPNTPETGLAQTYFVYDRRNRVEREDRSLFQNSSIGVLATGDLQARNPSFSGNCLFFGNSCVSKIYLHDKLGRMVGVVDGDDDLYQRRYDGLSRLIETRDPLDNRETSVYDANDNLKSVTQLERSSLITAAESFTTSTTYDSLNRPIRVTEPNGQQTTFAYDSRDNRIRRTDALGNQIEWRHDKLDRMTNERRYLSALVSGGTASNASASTANSAQGGGDGRIDVLVGYDRLHRVISRTDDNGKRTEYIYDPLHRIREVRYPDGTQETSTYNGDDEMLTHTKPSGSIETWIYDEKSRPIQLTVSNAASAATRGTTRRLWSYDGLDRVVMSFDDNGSEADVTIQTFYDSLSRRVRETQSITGFPNLTTDENWKAENQRVLTIYPNGRQIASLYDALDRESEIKEGTASIAKFDYVGPTRDVRVTLGNGALLDLRNSARTQSVSGTNPGYDTNRRNVRRVWATSTGGTIASYGMAYNAANVIVEERRNHLSRGDRFSLDSAYRLTHFRHNAPISGSGLATPGTSSVEAPRTSTWSLDGAHNWRSYTQRTVNLAPVLDTAGGVNEYSSFGGAAQAFDDDGNLKADGTRTYTYDFEDRLVELTSAAGVSQGRYVYDADGRRVLKITAGGTTRFLYRGWEEIEERGAGNSVVQQYVFRNGIDEPVQFKKISGSAVGTYYYHDDARGNVGALTNASQGIVYRTEYDAWGDGSLGGSTLVSPSDPNSFLATDPLGNPFLWQARRLDPESGLYNFRHRYYSSRQGRFIHADPPGSWFDPTNVGNRYAMAGLRPDGRDPLGLGFLKKLYQVGSDGIARVNARRVINGKNYAGKTYKFDCDLAQKYPEGVPFSDEGFPDFSKYREGDLLDPPDGFGKNRKEDFKWANRQAGYKETPDGFTWHHREDGKLELIPTDLHDAVRHTGGWSIWKAAQAVTSAAGAMILDYYNNPGTLVWDMSPYSTVDDVLQGGGALYEGVTGRPLPELEPAPPPRFEIPPLRAPAPQSL